MLSIPVLPGIVLRTFVFTCCLSWSALAAVTKHHRFCVLNSRNVLLSFRGWKSKIKVPADSVPGENSLSGLGNDFLLCPHMEGRKRERERERETWFSCIFL